MPQLTVSEAVIIYSVQGAMVDPRVNNGFFSSIETIWNKIYSHNRKVIRDLVVQGLMSGGIPAPSRSKWEDFLKWTNKPVNQIGY